MVNTWGNRKMQLIFNALPSRFCRYQEKEAEMVASQLQALDIKSDQSETNSDSRDRSPSPGTSTKSDKASDPVLKSKARKCKRLVRMLNLVMFYQKLKGAWSVWRHCMGWWLTTYQQSSFSMFDLRATSLRHTSCIAPASVFPRAPSNPGKYHP